MRLLRVRRLVALLVVTGALTPFVSSADAASNNTWTPAARLPVSQSAMGAATGPDGRIYTFGGFGADPPPSFGITQAYTPAKDSWTSRAPMPTPRRWLSAATGPDGRIYAAGGMAEDLNGNFAMNVVEAYNPKTNKWATVASMPTPRVMFGLVTYNGLIYAIGGCPGIHEDCTPVLGTVEAYNTATNTWTTKASMPTPRGGVAASLGPDGLIYVMGGLISARGPVVNTVEAYDPATDRWTTVAPMPSRRFFLAATTGPDGRIYAIGGKFPEPLQGGDAGLDTVEAYSTVTKNWAILASLPVSRFGLAASTSAGHVYAIGGSCWTAKCPPDPDNAGILMDSYTP